ncbi:MAG: V-type ATP synthase subunit B, partial [Nitrososphaeraceae archaeon]
MSNVAFKTLSKIAGPLIFVEGVNDAAYGEIVEIKLANGDRRQGQVLDTRQGLAIIQVFGPTYGLGTAGTSTKFSGETAMLSVSDEMLGRSFDGVGKPRDNGPKIISKEKYD